MELVSDEKLEAVADFLADDEVFGIAPCSHFNNSLKRNRVNVPCDIGDCDVPKNQNYSHDLTAFNELFGFIKWEDSKPTSIEDVLNNCEVVNDAKE